MAFAVEEATIESIQAALLAKEISVAELVGSYLERIERIDPQLNSIVTTSETALQRAEELDSAPRGPLHGVPVVLKDNINTHDMPTAYGSVAMKGYRPPQDATVAHRLRDAGAVIIAKTTLPDWATSWFSYSSLTNETRNPYDTNRDPGGSSSGTGAAVAANLAAVGLGTDCGGSIRLPPRSATSSASRSTPGVIPRRDVLPRDPAGHGRPDGAHGRRRGEGLRGDRRLRPRRPLQRGDDRHRPRRARPAALAARGSAS